MVASSDSSSHRSSGVGTLADQVAPEQDFGDRVVAVEGGMEREGEELGERGIARAATPDRRLRAPAAVRESPAAPARAGLIAAG